MVVPLAARYVAAAVGVLLVVTAASSVIGTLIVPRPVANWLTKRIDQLVNVVYVLITKPVRDFRRRDRILATHAATLLLCQIIAWLVMFFVGFSLIFWPLVHGGITDAFRIAGPGLWQIGDGPRPRRRRAAILDIATADRPHHRDAADRLPADAVLGVQPPGERGRAARTPGPACRAGGRSCWRAPTTRSAPASPPSTPCPTCTRAGSGGPPTSARATPPTCRWSGSGPRSRCRPGSPALLAVLDSAALMLSLNPSTAPVVPARLCLRAGFTCFRDVATGDGLRHPGRPDPEPGISITYEEFLDAIARLEEVDFPIERNPEDAWPDFVGWRVNYEQAAFAIAWSDRRGAGPVVRPAAAQNCPPIPPHPAADRAARRTGQDPSRKARRSRDVTGQRAWPVPWPVPANRPQGYP